MVDDVIDTFSTCVRVFRLKFQNGVRKFCWNIVLSENPLGKGLTPVELHLLRVLATTHLELHTAVGSLLQQCSWDF